MRELLIRVKIDDEGNIADAVVKKGFKQGNKIFEMSGIYAYLMQRELDKIKLKSRETRRLQ